MISEASAVDRDDGVVGASAPDFIKLFVEVGSRLWVDNETSFGVAMLEDVLKKMCSDIAARIASNGDNFSVLCRVTVISGEKSRFGFLKFWFNAGFLLVFCHDENSIPSLEKMCYNTVHHAESNRRAMIF